jgi:hypothetical protein
VAANGLAPKPHERRRLSEYFIRISLRESYGLLIYFYAHKLAGWVLGSFLVAGLAGLTQRN